MGEATVRVRKRWDEEKRKHEALPDIVWTHCRDKALVSSDAVFYLLIRRNWRPKHWKEQKADAGMDPLVLAQTPIAELFRIDRATYSRALNRIAAARTHCLNTLLSKVTARGHRGGTNLSGTWVQLWSLYQSGQLLDKHGGELLRYGHYDSIRHGLWLPFGHVCDGQVIRYILRPQLSLDAAGIYLFLLYLANLAARKQAADGVEPPPPDMGQLTLGPDFAVPVDEDFDAEGIAVPIRDFQAVLHVDLRRREPNFQELEKFGWLQRDVQWGKHSRYDVAGAPSGMLAVLALGYSAFREQPFRLVDAFLDDVEEGRMGMIGLLERVEEMGWVLTKDGIDLLRAEVHLAQREQGPDDFEPGTPVEEAIQDTLSALHLEDHTKSLLSSWGPDQVWRVVWHAYRQRQTLLDPEGFIYAALQRHYALPNPPYVGSDLAKPPREDQYGDILSGLNN